MFLKRPIYLSEQTVFLREHIKQPVKVVPSRVSSMAAMLGSGSDKLPESSPGQEPGLGCWGQMDSEQCLLGWDVEEAELREGRERLRMCRNMRLFVCFLVYVDTCRLFSPPHGHRVICRNAFWPSCLAGVGEQESNSLPVCICFHDLCKNP